jgi:hypothetical protein
MDAERNVAKTRLEAQSESVQMKAVVSGSAAQSRTLLVPGQQSNNKMGGDNRIHQYLSRGARIVWRE